MKIGCGVSELCALRGRGRKSPCSIDLVSGLYNRAV